MDLAILHVDAVLTGRETAGCERLNLRRLNFSSLFSEFVPVVASKHLISRLSDLRWRCWVNKSYDRVKKKRGKSAISPGCK